MTEYGAQYVGRFAPSPSGPLHFGSLLAAVASYAQTLVNEGLWLLRIEDIDPPREQAGSDKLILDALTHCGFEWDGPLLYQSTCTSRHLALVEHLVEQGLAYPCTCSRRDLAEVPRGTLGAIYPGTCRNGCGTGDVAIRLLTDDTLLEFTDVLQGRQSQRLQIESGDFVIRRRDGLVAYHLAVVVDDSDQGISEIVRGFDLLDSTLRHIHLQRVLGFSTPNYLHIPIAINNEGQKLSKLTGATGIDTNRPARLLFSALEALGQHPPNELAEASTTEVWQWVRQNWTVAPLGSLTELPAGQFGFD